MVERWNKIITKKLDKIKNDPNFKIIPINKTDNSKYLVLFKLTGGHYKDQTHILTLDLKCDKPNESPDVWFPARAPKTYFLTKMFHTNVSPNSGWICLDILNDKWSPMNNIDTLKYISGKPLDKLDIYCVGLNTETNFLNIVKIIKQIKSFNNSFNMLIGIL
jgi:ubiquitin-protein ligase